MKPIKHSPLSQIVKDMIFQYISENTFTDDKLPKEETLSEMLQVSRITVRSALKDLASEGFIFRKHGKGTFINTKALSIKSPLSPLKPFKDIITDLGYECTIKNLGYYFEDNPNDEIKKSLNLQKEDLCIVTKKVFYADKKPVVYCLDYFSSKILPSLEDAHSIKNFEKSIFEFFNTICNKKITWDLIEISTTTNKEDSHLEEVFKCGNEFKSFLLCKGINFNDDNEPICCNSEYIDTNYIKFNMIRKKIF